MCPTYVTFSTPKKSKFAWTDAFCDVENSELEELIVECRSALHSLEAEFAARQNPQSNTINLQDCYTRLQEKARDVNKLGVLSDKDIASLKEADTFLSTLRNGHINSSQTRETHKGGGLYERLLWLISRVAGPANTLLLICCATRRQMNRLSSHQSVNLIKYIAQHRTSLSSHVLERKASELGLCKTIMDLCLT